MHDDQLPNTAARNNASATKICFVISPIGAEGSATRQHADTVLSCIIEPACEAGDNLQDTLYKCERGDHKTAPGKITDQIYEDILNADLIVAVLTDHNPNVYYELAIAQAAAKRVILLMEKGFDAPFDIKDHRIIYYDFDPQSIFKRNYAKQLRAAINALDQRRSKQLVPFAPHLTPLGDPIQSIGSRATEAEPGAIRIVETAQTFLYMMGYSMHGWTMNEDFKHALRKSAPDLQKSEGACVLLAHPDNPTLRAAMKNDEAYSAASKMIEHSERSWTDLLTEILGRAFGVRLNNANTMGYQLLMNEREGIVVPYLRSRDTARSPYIFMKSESPYYEVMKEEFQFLWNASIDSHKGKTHQVSIVSSDGS